MEAKTMPSANAEALPAADVRIRNGPKGLTQTESFPVIPHKDEPNDYMIPIKKSTLKKFKTKLEQLKESKFQWDELLLAISTLFIGGIISAVIGNVEIATKQGIFFYIISPPIGMCTLVITIMLKMNSNGKRKVTADDVLSELEAYFKKDDEQGGKNGFK